MKPNDMEHFSSHVIKGLHSQLRTLLPLKCIKRATNQTIQGKSYHFVEACLNKFNNTKIQLLEEFLLATPCVVGVVMRKKRRESGTGW
jgi:hypothetical protein